MRRRNEQKTINENETPYVCKYERQKNDDE